MKNEAYQIKVMPGSAQTAIKDLWVQSSFGDGKVTDAPECTFIYTQSKPVIAEVGTYVSEYGDDRVYFTFSEWIRRDTMTGTSAPELHVDGIDRTICQGPPSCCISDSRCEQGGGSVQVGDETVVTDGWSYFSVPTEFISSFEKLELRIVASARGSKATFADAVVGMDNAKIEGDRVVWTFFRTEFKGHGKHLRWNPACK